MANAERLKELLHDERGYHFKVLANEYRKVAREFEAKAKAAERAYQGYRETSKNSS